ncbi:hypothetical protein ACJD0Z_14105 [Flavobacteriaceae bacterium M23B6Z8]
MKIIFSVCIAALFFSCKSEPKNEKPVVTEELTISEKIAKAHGYDAWKEVAQIDFTFNVDRDSSHFERSWSWKPVTNEVVMTTTTDTISYKRSKIDSLVVNADKGFINDRYWLLAPFNLVWDTGIKETYSQSALGPISGDSLQKLTIVYTSDGGYTPGDAYDFYFGDDYRIKEWVFRKKNVPEPSLITSWEDYQDFSGLHLATVHNKNEGSWKLYFTNIKVTVKN